MHEIPVETVEDSSIDDDSSFTPEVTSASTGLWDAEQSEKTIIGLTGMCACGKGVVVDLFDAMGVPTTSMGSVVRQVARQLDTDPWSAAQNLRGKCDTEIARRTRGVVNSTLADNDCVVVDGLRTPHEMRYYETQFDATFVLVDVFCDTSTRLDRYMSRENVDFETALTEVGERDERELNVGMGQLLDASDTTVYNDFSATYTDVCGQVERLVNAVGGIQ